MVDMLLHHKLSGAESYGGWSGFFGAENLAETVSFGKPTDKRREIFFQHEF
jgi:hypothetical protein